MIFEHKLKAHKEDIFLCYGGWDRDLLPGQVYGPVVRDTYIIECCTGGKGSVIINGKEFTVEGGDCYFLLPGDVVTHTADSVDPRTGVYCSVAGLRVGGYLSAAGITSESPFASKEMFLEITDLVEKLVQSKDDTDNGASLRRLGYLYEIFGVLLRNTGSQPLRGSAVTKAIHMMETCYPNALPIAKLAREVGLERCYFSTQFKKETGLSPYQYLARLRVQKACVLLEQANLSVAAVAMAVGIPPENFARLFKKWMNTTPRQYINAGKM